MTKRCIYTLWLLLLVYPMMAASPRFRSDEGHYAGFYVQGGYSVMPSVGADVQVRHGFNVGGGVLYEYNKRAFLLDIGCGFTWQQGGWGVNQQLLSQSTEIDSQGDEYTLQIAAKRYDVVRRGMVDIPIMIGGQKGAFYGLIGVKIGLGIVEKSYMHADITTIAVYDKYISPIHDAANHGLRTSVPIQTNKWFLSDMDIRASVELGAWVGEINTNNIHLKARLAMFVDCGVFMQSFHLNDVYIQKGPTMDIDRYEQFPILAKNGNQHIGNIMVGAKLTILMNSPQQTGCASCRFLDSHFRPKRHKHKCVICD